MGKEFDVIVIGSGPAGSSIAAICNDKGLNVAIVESDGFGGTCPLHGCIPKKVLTRFAEQIDQDKRMQGNGLESRSKIDWKQLMNYKRSFTEPVPKEKEKSLQDKGITTFHGEAAFVSESEIQVKDHLLKGNKIVIATGAKPTALPIEGEEHLTYSDAFLELDHLPKRIIFVGGGYISFEFAHIAARTGSEVHIIQHGNQPLKGFDPDLVELLVKQTEKIGAHVHLNASVKAIEKDENGYTVKAEKDDQEIEWEGDLVVHGAGRVPNIESLHLDKGNVKHDKGGIAVNGFLQSTSNPNVYAAGDAADTEGPPLTPVAHIDAEIISENILNGNEGKPDYNGVPSVAFTTPKLATVGMSEEEAKDSGKEVNYFDISSWFTYKLMKDDAAAAKIITDKDSGSILGAHLISDEADELINYFAMAIQLGLTTKDLKKVTYAFPTAVSDIPSML